MQTVARLDATKPLICAPSANALPPDIITALHRGGHIIVHGQITAGEATGQGVTLVSTAQKLEDEIRLIWTLPENTRISLYSSVRKAVRKDLLDLNAEASEIPEGLGENIAILYALTRAFRLNSDPESPVQNFTLLINDDAALPWHQRGLLCPKFENELVGPRGLS